MPLGKILAKSSEAPKCSQEGCHWGCNAEVAHDLGEGEAKVGFANVEGDTDHVPLLTVHQ